MGGLSYNSDYSQPTQLGTSYYGQYHSISMKGVLGPH